MIASNGSAFSSTIATLSSAAASITSSKPKGLQSSARPVQAPNANAHAERWVGSVRRECLDRLLIFSRRQLEQVLRVYARHYNRHRPHRSLAFRPPEQADRSPTPLRAPPYPQLNRRDLLGGLIPEYQYAGE